MNSSQPGSQDRDDEAVALDFLESYLNDVIAGKHHSLDHYLSQYPNHKDIILREFKEIDKTPSGAPHPNIDGVEILEKIGSGGMGTVYLGVQKNPTRRVAVKVLRDRAWRARTKYDLQHEQNLLARLDHPGIAKVFAADITDAGYPYLVMEHVDGKRIDRYADEAGLALRDRLNLVLAVCDAIEHAHQRRVLHLDLKPSNVLVASEESVATPKLIDFGVSELLDSVESDVVDSPYVFGTPGYSSPEQLSERTTVDYRSDVYGMGVLMAKLLTGSLPKPSSPQSLERQSVNNEIFEISEDFALASKTTTRALARSLKGDLAAIIRRCIQRDPKDRYSNVSALAQDIRAHLETRPISARSISWPERILRYAQRSPHRAAGIILIALFALYFVSLKMNERSLLEEKLELMQSSVEQGQALSRFASELLNLDDDAATGMNDMSFSAVVPKVTDILTRMQKASRHLRHHPQQLRNLHIQQANAFEKLALHEDAAESWLLAHSIQCDLDIRDPAVSRIESQLGGSLHETGDPHLASRLLARVSHDIELTQGPLNEHAIGTKLRLSRALRATGETRAALNLISEALRDAHQAFDPCDHRIGQILVIAARQSSAAGRHEEARLYALEGLSILGNLADDHSLVLSLSLNLAIADFNQGDPTALGRIESLVESYTDVLGHSHHYTLGAMTALSKAYARADRSKEARNLVEHVYALRKADLGDHFSSLQSMEALASLREKDGDAAGALAMYPEILERTRQTLGETHQNFFVALANQGRALASLESYRDAIPLYRRAIDGMERHHPERLLDALSIKTNLTRSLVAVGESSEAIELITSVVRDIEREHPQDFHTQINARMLLHKLLLRSGRDEEALANVIRIIPLQESRFGRTDSRTMSYVHEAIKRCERLGLLVEAGEWLVYARDVPRPSGRSSRQLNDLIRRLRAAAETCTDPSERNRLASAASRFEESLDTVSNDSG